MEGDFLGLANLSDAQKKHIYDILNSYQMIKSYTRYDLGVRVDDRKLAGVMGMLVENSTSIELGIKIGDNFFGKIGDRQVYFEKFDWAKLGVVASSMNNLTEKLLKVKSVNLGLKLLIGLRFANWVKVMLNLAKFGLYVLVFFSVLYVLVATQWGRDLTWDFLNVYGWIVKLILIIFLVIALVVIVGMVSFMYLENKNIKKEGDNA